MRCLKGLLGLLLISMLFGSAQVHAADVTLRVHHFLGEDSLPHKGVIEPWARRVEADSQGRIKVDIYPRMQLGGKTHELVDQVLDGTVDIVWTAAAYTPNRFPYAEVFTLPLVHGGDPAATNQAMMSAMDGFLQRDFRGMKPLLVHVQTGHSLHLSRKSAKTLSDLDGLVMRPAGRRVGLWVLDALGASSTKKRHPKLSESLAENRLDGALMSFQLAQSLDAIKSVKSHTMLGNGRYFGTSLYLFLMNPDSYQALPADLQAVIDQNSGMKLAKEVGLIWQKAEQDAIEAARKHGNTINVLDAEQQQLAEQSLAGIHQRWSDTVLRHGIDGRQLIEKARQAISRFTEQETRRQ